MFFLHYHSVLVSMMNFRPQVFKFIVKCQLWGILSLIIQTTAPETPRKCLWRPKRIICESSCVVTLKACFWHLSFQELIWFYEQVKQVIDQSISSKASQGISTFIIRLGKPAMVLNSLKYAEFNWKLLFTRKISENGGTNRAAVNVKICF